jgi:hypothetical protein
MKNQSVIDYDCVVVVTVAVAVDDDDVVLSA